MNVVYMWEASPDSRNVVLSVQCSTPLTWRNYIHSLRKFVEDQEAVMKDEIAKYEQLVKDGKIIPFKKRDQ
jgi:hypothetical protein